MKKVNKNYIIKPYSLQSIRRTYHNAINNVLANQGWYSKASSIYKSDSVLNELLQIYNGKCAYCEQIPVGSPPQVEHFRPKDGVNGIVHSGYYWLAFEWSNLLLSCGNCNSKKGTHFPLLNDVSRVFEPDVLSDGINEDANFIGNSPLKFEKPKLLNPEIDNPEEHITFSPSGEVIYFTEKGEESIFRYNLNRDELYVNGRKKKRDDIELKFLRSFKRYTDNERTPGITKQDLIDIILDEIVTPIRYNMSYSEFFKQMLLNFEDFFVIGDAETSALLNEAFKTVICNLQII